MERRMSLVVPPVEELVRSDHEYRLMLKILDWGKLARPLRALYSDLNRVWYRWNKRARYRGVGKNGFQVSMQALAFNLKRLIRLAVPPLSGIVAEPIPLIAG
jgi:hypothetical protein